MGIFGRLRAKRSRDKEGTGGEIGSLGHCASSGAGRELEEGCSLEPFMGFFGEDGTGVCFDGSAGDLVRKLGGRSFGDGLIRFFTLEEKEKWESIVSDSIPFDAYPYELFSFTWDGACLGVGKSEEGSVILLFDGADLRCKPIPMTLADFLNVEIPADCDGYLAAASYREWLDNHPAPGWTECVGHKIPLFLGGKDNFDNMEIIDMEVQWDMTSQIWQAVRDLPPGTPIGSIRFE